MAAAGIFITTILFTVATIHCSFFPTSLSLERRISPNLELSQLRELDSSRHRRTLLSNTGDIILPVQGQYQPPNIGLYYTKLRIGTPPKDFYVQIDTGSNAVWVSCASCMGCPTKSNLGFPINFYDPGTSSTSGLVPCLDNLCNAGSESSDSFCSQRTSLCGFALPCNKGKAYGYYVSDLLYMFAASDSATPISISAPLVFGCTALLAGNGTQPSKAAGGMLGLGPRNLSFISQLASLGITPRVFSHCLKGDVDGGGLLVLGEITAPRIVYTPLQSKSQYNLNLESISVANKTLAIDRSIFRTTDTQGTIVDSGTTLAYLADGAYDTVIEAISDFANAISYPINMYKCFLLTPGIDNLFPKVSLNFVGGASMVLYPKDYLVKQRSLAGDVRCIGFEKNSGQQLTILGDLVLKDKLIIYDMENQRFGWTDYNCSVAEVVSSTMNNAVSQQVKSNNSRRNVPCKLILMIIISVLLHMFSSSNYVFL